MRLIITGATGMAGSELVRQSIIDPAITEIIALVRKPLDVSHPKIKTIIHNNFLDYSRLASVFANSDACVWCLGISQNLVSKSEYYTITHDYAVSAAQEMLKHNPKIKFLFLSGMGAASSEKSLTLFGRVKGKTENSLKKLPFKELYIARPGGIIPEHENKNIVPYLKLQNFGLKIMETLVPFLSIKSSHLAKVFLHIVKNGYNKQMLSHSTLKKIAKEIN